ncbi:hypothetical protein PAPYR_9918 [Paratrimastix pyriformis]|uniref:Secreted protein n=1 Tax=Paratrimastix pyriformis TaxID=342808 RepID=A0ABQ8U755_9EUKA|nr:hypothetical protein PAPYR_9918 [Paratrimastix pyriformis]
MHLWPSLLSFWTPLIRGFSACRPQVLEFSFSSPLLASFARPGTTWPSLQFVVHQLHAARLIGTRRPLPLWENVRHAPDENPVHPQALSRLSWVFLRFWCPMHPFVGPVPFVTAALRLSAEPNSDIPREKQ